MLPSNITDNELLIHIRFDLQRDNLDLDDIALLLRRFESLQADLYQYEQMQDERE